MPARALFQFLDRVGRNISRYEIKKNMYKGRPCINMHGNLKRGVAFEKRFLYHYVLIAQSAVISARLEIRRRPQDALQRTAAEAFYRLSILRT